MTSTEIEASKYAAPRFAYRRHEDGNEYAFVSFRWKLGTDYDPALDTSNSYQYRKCRDHLERLQNKKTNTTKAPPARLQTSSSSSSSSSTSTTSNQRSNTVKDASATDDNNADATATTAHADEQPTDGVVKEILKPE